jgi:hypothetical protein
MYEGRGRGAFHNEGFRFKKAIHEIGAHTIRFFSCLTIYLSVYAEVDDDMRHAVKEEALSAAIA